MARYRYRDLGVATVDRSGRPIEVLAGVTAGPAGPQGPTGPRGGRGLQGPQGIQGPAGSTGPAGTGKWTVLDPADGDLPTQLAAMASGDRYWLLPGTWDLNGGDLTLGTADVVVAGSRQAIIEVDAGEKIDITADHVFLIGVTVENVNLTGGETESILVQGDYDVIEDIELNTDAGATARAYGIRLNTSDFSTVRNCYLHPNIKATGGYIVVIIGSSTNPDWIVKNHIAVTGTPAPSAAVYAVGSNLAGSNEGTWVHENHIDIGSVDYCCGVRPDTGWDVSNNSILSGGALSNMHLIRLDLAATQVRIANNYLYQGATGIFADAAVQDLNVSNNEITGSNDYGVYVTGGFSRVVIAGNNISIGAGGSQGITVDPGSAAYNLVIADNEINGSGSHGINITPGTVVLRDIAITGNLVLGATDTGIRLNGTNMTLATIDGNAVYYSGDYGIDVSGSVLVVALYSIAGNVIISGNVGIQVINVEYFSIVGNTVENTGGVANDGIITVGTSDHYSAVANVSPDGFTWVDNGNMTQANNQS